MSYTLKPVLMLLQASERFLQQMVSLYVASHYKNTPNDLLLMADAPAHQLFALLAPVNEEQVCLCCWLFLHTPCWRTLCTVVGRGTPFLLCD